ncbi:hypothetical protein Q5741_01565 [Paenibacillus sp. JX-17]|uniref:Uncharacterized protein n=1 Tax=Paenibacillus lacisoli TaxID=3064525 RepID=A0ABT9C767_9BACL|nr:hypothetical protein [Paenibacillus sp. JX-17]MDO7905099.1 hypothetical protein [Paenibacillus sp. JX-17]
MKTSSFFLGLVVGAAAQTMMQRRNFSLFSSGSKGGNSVGQMVNQAKNTVMDAAFPGMGSMTDKLKDGENNSRQHNAAQIDHKSTIRDKEANFRMLKDFIRTNPDVKKEVEAILKDTHTAIPGL